MVINSESRCVATRSLPLVAEPPAAVPPLELELLLLPSNALRNEPSRVWLP